MKRTSLFIYLMTTTVSMHAVHVSNYTGHQNVWGAIYYVFSDSAQRSGSPTLIANQATLALPQEEKSNAARYLIISRSEGGLEPIITDPFGTVGVRLIPLDTSNKAYSITIDQSQLPDEMVR